MRRRTLVLAAALVPLLAACSSDDGMMDAGDAAAIVSVSPAGGAVNVDVNGRVAITFNHAIMAGMEQYAVLHTGGGTGAPVNGTWALSTDRKVLTFTPAAALAAKTQYTIHLGGGMMDDAGHAVNMSAGTMMGGLYATGTMMSGGMIFTFTTA